MSEVKYVYPGSKGEFKREYGGLPRRQTTASNIVIVTIIIVMIVVIVVALLLLRLRTIVVYTDRNGLVNLDKLVDINKPSVECCVYPGSSAPNQEYVYDTINNITYSRLKPTNIDTVCNTFADPATCIAQNTDGKGNIIPYGAFRSTPYYTFESGLFIQCASTTMCNAV